MNMLYSTLCDFPQFASVSLLLKPSVSSEDKEGQPRKYEIDMVEPMTSASPLATISLPQTLDILKELHSYLTDVIVSSTSHRSDTSTAMKFLREDSAYIIGNSLQAYHPFGGGGLAIQYRLLRSGYDGINDSTIEKLASIVLSSNKINATTVKIDPSIGLLGVIVSIGFSGSHYRHCGSSIQHQMNQRVNECVALMSSDAVMEASTAKVLLQLYLLTDDECRKTNEMIRSGDLLIIPEPIDSDNTGIRNLLSPIGMISPIAEIGRKSKRTPMQGRGGQSGMTDNGGKFAGDLGFALGLEVSSADAARTLTEQLRALSFAEHDSKLRKYGTSAAERKANLDQLGAAKSRFRRTRKGDNRDPDFDNFDYKGPVRESFSKAPLATPKSFPTLTPAPDTSSKLTIKSSKKDTTSKRIQTPGTSNRRMSAQSEGPFVDDDSTQQPSRSNNSVTDFDPFAGNLSSKLSKTSRIQFDDDASQFSGFPETTSVASQARVSVNIALNEDLTCSYKNSQLSTCTVEGMIQASIKSSGRQGSPPIFLYIRDPLSHIETVNENKKVVQDMSHTLTSRDEEDEVKYKFQVNIPKMDSYYSVMKYKCSGELRPVPIRVQTKVKVENGTCRVALQISSNPNNTNNLKDLNIIMNAPNSVHGESLITQPAGGIWDEEKSCVLWCVAELGSGEKFQLQARFEMLRPDIPMKDLNFPVLVRCQCLSAQLSDIEIEVSAISDSLQVDFIAKVARRYRLSHKERH